jgi:hypothetical protein
MRLDRGQIETIDDDLADVFRHKTSAERIQIGFNIWLSAQNMLRAHLKSIHPDWNIKQVQTEVARRLSHGAL